MNLLIPKNADRMLYKRTSKELTEAEQLSSALMIGEYNTGPLIALLDAFAMQLVFWMSPVRPHK